MSDILSLLPGGGACSKRHRIRPLSADHPTEDLTPKFLDCRNKILPNVVKKAALESESCDRFDGPTLFEIQSEKWSDLVGRHNCVQRIRTLLTLRCSL
jgi:hypothetical protein